MGEQTKEWLRSVCLEDEDGPSSQLCHKSLSASPQNQAAEQKLAEHPIARPADYEGLDQTDSNPPSGRPSQHKQQRQKRPTYSTIPLPGEHYLSPQIDVRPAAAKDCPEAASVQQSEGHSPQRVWGDYLGLEGRSSLHGVSDSKPPPLQDPFTSGSGPSMAQDWG